MKLGNLSFVIVKDNTPVVAEVVARVIGDNDTSDIYVSEIDPNLSDTAAFCAAYSIGLDISANCVVIEAKRGQDVWYAACVILATDKVDVNGIVRRFLDARKTSFAVMDRAISLTGMEYGGITPIGLPVAWSILVDKKVADSPRVIVGSGRRASKLLVSGGFLAKLPHATVLNIAKP